MKKFLAFLLAAGMLTGIAACGTTKDNDTTTSSEKPSETTAGSEDPGDDFSELYGSGSSKDV